MKEITLKITGKQIMDDHEEENMEFVTDGRLYLKNDDIYVVYDETELSGMTGCQTTLRFRDGSVRMKRTGETGFGTELYFEVGKRFSSSYETPYGPMEIEVLTKMIKNNLNTEQFTGNVDIEYDVSLGGMAEGKNKLTINLM